MTNYCNVVAFVPIRLNSTRVPHKSIQMVGGKPLCHYVLETLRQVPELSRIYVYTSTDSIKLGLLQHLPEGVEVWKRPTRLDGSETLGIDIYQQFARDCPSSWYLLCHVTSPFITVKSIQKGLQGIEEGYDSSCSVQKHQTFTWFRHKPLNYDRKAVLRTQDLTPVLTETSAFYLYSRNMILQEGIRIGSNPKMVVTTPLESIDIDTKEDLELVRQILGNKTQSGFSGSQAFF
mgnify:CR=1 FL=1